MTRNGILYAEPEALCTIAGTIAREWGSYGYTITDVSSPVGGRAALAEVQHTDGSTFYVGATRYGNTVHASDRESAERALLARVVSERAQ